MKYNFDEVFNRKNTGSTKWDLYKNTEIVPFWVADMDFKTCPEIIERFHEKVESGIYGYTVPKDDLYESIMNWTLEQYQWKIEKEWIIFTPGLGSAINISNRALCEKGESVLTPTPVYYPFLLAPNNHQLESIEVYGDYNNLKWTINIDHLKSSLKSNTTLFQFCNPHNPLGRVYSRNELEEVAQFCLENQLFIMSDEVHCDLILDQTKKHIPLASLSKEVADTTVTLMSAAKTFNLAGIYCGFMIVSNPKLRGQVNKAMAGIVPNMNYFSYESTSLAFQIGDAWRNQLLDYLRSNADIVSTYFNEMQELELTQPIEATYLAWLKVLDKDKIKNAKEFFEKNAQVGLSDGHAFGAPHFLRLNFGCPKQQLIDGLERMKRSLL